MNAYELADELQELDAKLHLIDLFKSAVMLREQADRIAELENEVKRLVGAEPITYGRLTFCKNCGQQDPYTQTKPLSDEEIWDWFRKNTALTKESALRIARAIEERHGIK